MLDIKEKCVFEIYFAWGDNNLNGKMDESDYFIFDGAEEVSMDLWMKLTNRYLTIGTNEVQWNLLKERSRGLMGVRPH